MSKMSELDAAITELRKCGETLIGVSETLRDLFSSGEPEKAAEVQSLLNVDDRVSAVLTDLRDGFQNELHIVVGVGIHLVAVVLGDGLAGLAFQRPAELVLTQSVGSGALGSSLSFTILELQLQPS